MQTTNEARVLRPYELPKQKYGLWFAVGEQLGVHAQVALEQWLCAGKRIVPPYGEKLDEQSIEVIKTLARQRSVFIPPRAFE